MKSVRCISRRLRKQAAPMHPPSVAHKLMFILSEALPAAHYIGKGRNRVPSPIYPPSLAKQH